MALLQLDQPQLGPNGDFLVRTADTAIDTSAWDDALFEGARSHWATLRNRYTNDTGELDVLISLGELVAANVSRTSAEHGVPADPIVMAMATAELAMPCLIEPLASCDRATTAKDITTVATTAYLHASRIAA